MGADQGALNSAGKDERKLSGDGYVHAETLVSIKYEWPGPE